MRGSRVFGLVFVAVAATSFAIVRLAPRSTAQVASAAMPTLLADSVKCDLAQYKASAGLTAAVDADGLLISWNGQGGAELRARYSIDGGSPVVRDLSVRKAGGPWVSLGQNLSPEYRVTTAIRRLPDDQGNTLRGQGIDLTPEMIDKHRWYAFWDSPLSIPGHTVPPPAAVDTGRAGGAGGARQGGGGRRGSAPPVLAGGRVYGLPRRPEDVRRGVSAYSATSCAVKTDGSSLAVTFPGLKLGIFDGSLRFTVYRGTNLVQMDALARTNEPWVAYKYDAGLTGLTTTTTPRVIWRDTGGWAQQHQFGGPKANGLSGVRAQNRLLVAEGPRGSLATFPPPHTFFFTREVDVNLGYVFYRNDGGGKYSIGITMPEAESDTFPNYKENYSLYNAPPGTLQKMSVFFYASPETGETTRKAALAFTHGDTFKPIEGYKTFVNHFHLRVVDRMRVGGFDTPLQDLMAMKAIGLNLIGLSDFHADNLAGGDYGPARFRDQKDYAEVSRRLSDKDFLVLPWEEPSVAFGGHYNAMWPKSVLWSKTNTMGGGGGRGGEGQAGSAGGPAAAPTTLPFTENDPTYGKVYHTGSAEAMQRLLDAEGGYWYHAHPRTKSTANYPDAIWGRDYVKNDRYLGVAFKPGMGMDLSDKTMCEYRCFDAVDTMNNAFAGLGIGPKYVIADIDTYRKGPEDDLYANFPVNYLKMATTPGPDQDWSPVLKAMRDGNFFGTTGEILIRDYAVTGTGNQRTITADAEWTFPLAFVEVVSGDGKTVAKQVISTTELTAFGSKKFVIPFDATGKVWVRFSLWDVAGNGAFAQPVWLK